MTKKKCTKYLLDGSKKKCVEFCPEGSQFYCDEEITLADKTTYGAYQCISSCPVSSSDVSLPVFAAKQDKDYLCAIQCGTDSTFDINGQKYSIYEITQISGKDQYVCASCGKTADGKPFVYDENGNRECRSMCPDEKKYYDYTPGGEVPIGCSSTCKSGYFKKTEDG